MIIVHRWTIYSEQVRTRADSPAHRGELLQDVLAELVVGTVIDGGAKLRTVTPSMSIREVMKIADISVQRTIPVVDADGQLQGILSADIVRAILAEDPARGLVIAHDLLCHDIPMLRSDDSVQRALELLALQHVDELPVVSDTGALLGLLDRRAILGAYRRRIVELRGPIQDAS